MARSGGLSGAESGLTDDQMSPDDSEFEKIYRSLPPGLVLVACGGGYFQPLRSFCFSLKGAAIRIGTNAMHFDWNLSRENWDSSGGIQHFRDFIDLHHSQGIRMFIIDGSPASGSRTQRTAELLRSPMMLRSLDQDIARLIEQEVLAKNVTVVVTAIAEVVAEEHAKKALADLDNVIQQKQKFVETMRRGIDEMERQFRMPDAEAAIAALPKDVAEQVQEARAALPGMISKMHPAEADVTELALQRKGLKRKKSQSQLLTLLNTRLYSGSWKGILLGRGRVDDDWYSATVGTSLEVEGYGRLYFLWDCPQPPVAPRLQSVARPPTKHRLSWIQRLLGLTGRNE
jgi:hypothetical protein